MYNYLFEIHQFQFRLFQIRPSVIHQFQFRLFQIRPSVIHQFQLRLFQILPSGISLFQLRLFQTCLLQIRLFQICLSVIHQFQFRLFKTRLWWIRFLTVHPFRLLILICPYHPTILQILRVSMTLLQLCQLRNNRLVRKVQENPESSTI